MALEAFTIGHSTLSYEDFRELFKRHGVNAIADVRSSPVSKYFPHFSRRELQSRLKEDGVAYVFLGKELGGRPERSDLYTNGIADYEKMASTSDFEAGIGRVIEGTSKYKIALMCSEHDPMDCHRCLLVARALGERSIAVRHILANGRLTSQEQVEEGLLQQLGRSFELFESKEQTLSKAYAKRANKVAYRADNTSHGNHVAAE